VEREEEEGKRRSGGDDDGGVERECPAGRVWVAVGYG